MHARERERARDITQISCEVFKHFDFFSVRISVMQSKCRPTEKTTTTRKIYSAHILVIAHNRCFVSFRLLETAEDARWATAAIVVYGVQRTHSNATSHFDA